VLLSNPTSIKFLSTSRFKFHLKCIDLAKNQQNCVYSNPKTWQELNTKLTNARKSSKLAKSLKQKIPDP